MLSYYMYLSIHVRAESINQLTENCVDLIRNTVTIYLTCAFTILDTYTSIIIIVLLYHYYYQLEDSQLIKSLFLKNMHISLINQ